MKTRLFAVLSLASALTACATLNTPQNCQRATEGLTGARQLLAVLEAVKPEAVVKAAAAVALAEAVVAKACVPSRAS